MRLSGADENFTHQVAFPHSMVGSSDPSWRERYWISIQDTENRDTVLTLGIGQYPNQDVQEAFAVLSSGGTQRNLRVSRALSSQFDHMAVGPLRIEVVEPYRELRLVLEDNPSGLAFDITWRGRFEPMLEDKHFQMSRNRVTYDAIRYVQVGRAEGRITTPDREFLLDPETWWSERDHSWGTRTLPRVDGAPPAERPEWRMLMFAPIQFEDFALHLYEYEAEPGKPLHLSAVMTGPGVDATIPVTGIEHDLEWVIGAPAPTLAGGRLVLRREGGADLVLDLEACPGRAHLRGGGYEGWNGWFQGHWKGEDSLEHDVWDLNDDTQIYRYAKAGSDHQLKVTHQGKVGYGIMEYVLLTGYPRYQDAIPPRRA
jgi:hypothetical protein